MFGRLGHSRRPFLRLLSALTPRGTMLPSRWPVDGIPEKFSHSALRGAECGRGSEGRVARRHVLCLAGRGEARAKFGRSRLHQDGLSSRFASYELEDGRGGM